jgi:hypothetical protein
MLTDADCKNAICPAGMRRHTYTRLMDKLTECEERREDGLSVLMARLLDWHRQ